VRPRGQIFDLFKNTSLQSHAVQLYVSRSKFESRGSTSVSRIWVPHLMHGISIEALKRVQVGVGRGICSIGSSQ
jgi:hypothetical protein